MNRLIALAIAVALTSSAAMANEPLVTRHGNWESYYIKGSLGVPMCGLKAPVTQSGGMFLLKAQADGSIAFDLYKDSWRIPPGSKIPISFGFDGKYQYSTTATAMDGDKEHGGMAPGIYFFVSPNFISGIIDWLKAANVMWIGFRAGNEQPWRIDMTGSSEATDQWRMCSVAVMSGPPAESTQPSTQPFAIAPPAPKTVQTYPVPAPTQELRPLTPTPVPMQPFQPTRPTGKGDI